MKHMVYKFKSYDGMTDVYVYSTRMATLDKIESSNHFELIPGSGIEINSDRLIPGEGWTEEHFIP